MAVPDRRDPNETRAPLSDLGDQREVENVSRGGWRWWWVFPVIVALAIWWAGWGWGGTGGWWWGNPNRTAATIQPKNNARTTETLANAGAHQPLAHAVGTQKQPMSGPGVQILKAPDKQAYVGKKFAASDVPVQQKVNDRTLWIGEGNPMLAVVTGQERGAANQLTSGAIVDAQGTVEKAPPESQAKSEWNLSDQDAARLEHEGVYIQISELYLPQQ